MKISIDIDEQNLQKEAQAMADDILYDEVFDRVRQALVEDGAVISKVVRKVIAELGEKDEN